ncbi:MAG: hypothetical protein Q9208_001881 [Pyrenodesmia sp. 3 TL-2023]
MPTLPSLLSILASVPLLLVTFHKSTATAISVPASTNNNPPRGIDATGETYTFLEPHARCLISPLWNEPAFTNPSTYTKSCQRAMQVMRRTLLSANPNIDVEFELLGGNAKAVTAKPLLRLPRLYTEPAYEGPGQASCVLAVATIASLGGEFLLPNQRDREFGLSDTMTLRQLLAGTGHVYYECMAKGLEVPSDYTPLAPGHRIPAFGWQQVGM